MTLNLHEVVDKALDRSPAADPHQVARNALMRIAPADREDALLIALATYTEARLYERQGDPRLSDTVALADSLRTAAER